MNVLLVILLWKMFVLNIVEVLNKSLTPPFDIFNDNEVSEELRLKYRYLDLRRNRMRGNIFMRYKMVKAFRDLLDKENFIEIETPILIKGTPEGSREYLVPSRLYPENFYVLPQSPQQLKQLLMVAGFDKYFQVARSFRDEDQRGDRQPEFTQVDIEMSFVETEDIMDLNEKIMIEIVNKLASSKVIKSTPFPRLTYKEAMEKFGSDKPDLRFDLEIVDITDVVKHSDFKVFSGASYVKALKVDGGAKFSRKEIDEFTEIAKIYKAKGLAYLKVTEDGYNSPILKFLSEFEIASIVEKTGATVGDIVFFAADEFGVVCEALGQVRLECGKRLSLIDENVFAFCWIYDFPLFNVDNDTNRLNAEHHPFTAPKEEDIALLDTKPESVRAQAFDLALNGVEVGGGSIRIHDAELQAKIFRIMDISDNDAKARFGHLLHAFEFGAPPHGGVAWGLDRLVMLFQNESNIREVIAFPKDQKARDLMLDAPSPMPAEQIAEANIAVIKHK